jgi:hypothetical protein
MARGLAEVPWPAIVGILAAVTMTLGNLTALHQNNLKRLLAYSSISHAGYALMGLSAASALGVQSVMVYMLVYLFMNLGAFLAVIVIAQATGSETVADCKGLARRHPLLAVTFAIFLHVHRPRDVHRSPRRRAGRAPQAHLPDHPRHLLGRPAPVRHLVEPHRRLDQAVGELSAERVGGGDGGFGRKRSPNPEAL